MVPNPVKTFTRWAQAQPSVTALCSNRVSYRLEGTYPAIRVTDVGPVERAPGERFNRVQVECWAADYDSAFSLASAVDQAIQDGTLRGVWGGQPCAGGAVVSGPFANPDETTQKFCHTFDVDMWLYATPPN